MLMNTMYLSVIHIDNEAGFQFTQDLGWGKAFLLGRTI